MSSRTAILRLHLVGVVALVVGVAAIGFGERLGLTLLVVGVVVYSVAFLALRRLDPAFGANGSYDLVNDLADSRDRVRYPIGTEVRFRWKDRERDGTVLEHNEYGVRLRVDDEGGKVYELLPSHIVSRD